MGTFKIIKQVDFGRSYVTDKTGIKVPVQSFAPAVGQTVQLGEKVQYLSSGIFGYNYVIGTDKLLKPFTAFILAEWVAPVTVNSSTNLPGSGVNIPIFTDAISTASQKTGINEKTLILAVIIIGIVVLIK